MVNVGGFQQAQVTVLECIQGLPGTAALDVASAGIPSWSVIGA